MVLLGVILVLLAAAAGVVLIAGTAQLTDSVQIDVLGGTLSIPPLTLLITGMVVISVFWLGWAMLRGGLRRSKRRRVEAKEAAAAAEARRREEPEQKRLQDEFAAREQASSRSAACREQAEARCRPASTPRPRRPRTGPTTSTERTAGADGDAEPATPPSTTHERDATRARGTATARSEPTGTRRDARPAAATAGRPRPSWSRRVRSRRRAAVDQAGPGSRRRPGREASPSPGPAVARPRR